MINKRRSLTILGSLFTLTVLSGGSVLGAELFFYKPYPGTLQYNLSIKTHALLDTGLPGRFGKIVRDHEDIMNLIQRVKETDTGLLDIATTIEKINFLPHGPTHGATYKREEIEGNTQHVKINLLGKVEEAHVLPHIGSWSFWQEGGEDGPPLDFYNIMLMLNPRFPLELLEIGDSWESEDEMELGLAEALPVAGLMELHYELELTVRQKIQYTLLDWVEKKGYRCIRIGFEAKFRTDGVLYDAHTGTYVAGTGESSGEYYFAPAEGLLVSASITHKANEKRSIDGSIKTFLTRDEPMFLYSYDRPSIPIPWRSERTVSLELVEPQAITKR